MGLLWVWGQSNLISFQGQEFLLKELIQRSSKRLFPPQRPQFSHGLSLERSLFHQGITIDPKAIVRLDHGHDTQMPFSPGHLSWWGCEMANHTTGYDFAVDIAAGEILT